MSTAVPRDIRETIRQKIWAKADELSWAGMSGIDRTTWYENWTKDKDIGGVLSHFMDARRVRVYIKDSLLKPYLRSHLHDELGQVLIAVGIKEKGTSFFKRSFDKPHGRQLSDGKIICWGNSRDWKAIVISVYERAYKTESATPFAAVLIDGGRTQSAGSKQLIADLGKRLGISQICWI